MTTDTMIALFWLTESALALVAIVLCIAQFVLRRPLPVQIPSVYWPIAELGFYPKPIVRKVFRRLFSRGYRKRFWNPLMNTPGKNKGFDRQRHLSSNNIHAASSAMALGVVAFFLYFAHTAALSGQFQAQRTCYLWATAAAGFELVYNTPAIVLSRYLYLLTTRRPGRTKGLGR